VLIYLWIALGGMVGTWSRYFLSSYFAGQFGEQFPWGTIIINVTGSYAIGFFSSLVEPGGRVTVSPELRLFFMVGFCGGYTTFSSYSLQTLKLAQQGQWFYALGNVFTSNILCLSFVWLGAICATALRK